MENRGTGRRQKVTANGPLPKRVSKGQSKQIRIIFLSVSVYEEHDTIRRQTAL